MRAHDVEQITESRERHIADTFVALSDTLTDDFDVIDYLCVLTRSCVELLPVAAAGVLLADHRGQLHPLAASDEPARLLELFEVQNGQGPCLDCFRSGTPIVDGPLDAAGTLWPAFAARARASGYAVAHALPLRLRDTVVGALSLFADAPEPLAAADLDLGRSLADIAAIGILHRRAIAHAGVATTRLQRVLTSRVVIEQAKGVIAERMRVHVDDALSVLRAHARRRNLPLSELARAVAEGADLDGPDDLTRQR
jgi:hypothetical protein